MGTETDRETRQAGKEEGREGGKNESVCVGGGGEGVWWEGGWMGKAKTERENRQQRERGVAETIR